MGETGDRTCFGIIYERFTGRGVLVAGAVAVLAVLFIQGERLPHGGDAKALTVLAAPPVVVSEVAQQEPPELEKPGASSTVAPSQPKGGAAGGVGMRPTAVG